MLGSYNLLDEYTDRLVIKGWDQVRKPTNLANNLATRLPALGLIFLGEMDEFIRLHGGTLRPITPPFPEICLIGVPDHNLGSAISRILADPILATDIEYIDPDFTMYLRKPTAQLGSNFDLYASGAKHGDYRSDLKIASAHAKNATGSQARVAVIDTGVDPNILQTHFIDLTSAGLPSNTYVDGFGHGSAMVKIIQDVAPGSKIFAIRITDSQQVKLWEVMAGVKVAVFDVNISADIVNMSLGCNNVDWDCPRCGGKGYNRSAVFEAFLDTIQRQAGIGGNPDPIFVAAVGNAKQSDPFDWPARYGNTLAVGSIRRNTELSSFSNAATQKSGNEYCLCPGGEWDDQDTSKQEWVGEGKDANSNPTYCVGTSPATAYASAVLALYRDHFLNELKSAGRSQTLSSAEMMDEVYKRCDTSVAPNYDQKLHGRGRLVFNDASYTGGGGT
jgi:hypothetical protein